MLFIMDGIRNGFSLIDNDVDIDNIPSAFVPNSSSATSPSVRHHVEQQLLMELNAGQYKLVQHKPKIVSAFFVSRG